MPEETKKLSLRLPLDIYDYLTKEAKRERLSLHTLMIRTFDEKMKRDKEKPHE